MNLANEISDTLVKELQEELDWQIMMSVLMDYTHIKLSGPVRIDESKANEMKQWCKDNLKDQYYARGNDWLFKDKCDAEWFVLRWV
jgi:hypothetical protein